MTEEIINSPNKNSIVERLSTSNTLPSIKLTSFEEHNSDSDDVNGSLSYSRTKTKSKLLAKFDSYYDKEDDFNQVELSLQKTDFNDQGNTFLPKKKKSRIKNISSSESETESKLDNESNEADGNYDLTRSKMKKNELHDKFKKFKSRPKTFPKESIDKLNSGSNDSNESNNSDDGISCLQIKQKLKKKSRDTLKLICDRDTSDEETNISIKKQPTKSRSTKLTSPKAVRMSVKQAMENMQKIKSESNRMLREKEVSLPYHRPKALTLKDIMSRRRPGLSSDGKSLPIKMNNEQLKQYAISLEQRQQEMMELCKSDTDNEEECLEEVIPLNGKDSQLEANNQISDGGIQIMVSETVDMISDVNDKTFDRVIMEQNTESNLEDKVGDIEQLTPDKISQIKNNRDLVNNNDSQYIVKEITENKKDTGIVFMEEIGSVHETERVNNEPTANCNDSEKESQLISLHYDSEKSEVPCVHEEEETNEEENYVNPVNNTEKANSDEQLVNLSDEFSDTEFTQEELDKIIENAEVNKETSRRPMLHFGATLGAKPKIAGAPGMLIDLGADCSSKKLTGVELLKERFTYFAKLKTSEDMEKDREKKFKPGTQHLKLKQELEEKLAEKRSLEWIKRLEEENKLKTEISDVERELYDGEDIEKIEAKLEDDIGDQEISTSEEEEEKDICDLKEKRRKQNPLIDDEAEVSEDDVSDNEDNKIENHEDRTITSEDDDDDESSESEREKEEQLKPRKGRILKAFEDSDDENGQSAPSIDTAPHTEKSKIRESQDDEIQLAQPQNACSEDLFASQESSQKSLSTDLKQDANSSLEDLGSQTFSILKSGSENICSEKLVHYEKLDVICETQPCTDDNFDAIVGMCTGGFAENLVTPQDPSSQLSTSQEIGEDIAALCTGKFYDNPFVSQVLVENETDFDSNIAIACTNDCNLEEQREIVNTIEKPEENIKSSEERKYHDKENTLLKSILNELADPEFDSPKPNKYFCGASKYSNKDDDTQNVENTQLRKKFVIESDDEVSDVNTVTEKKKKPKKRKPEHRALQISDDEEENSDLEEETSESDLEEDKNREVEYDSEENEVEIETKVPKKRLGRDFFEQEAELSSEDEWMGSGDEDERGLDRMEREEGDDDIFHQGRLQRKLGEIHMREVLDQDKREVRLLQELLFEDGDLGDGHRQRKFRWKNADGEEELGTNVNEYADTQEEEFESEEQWRKQRHERQMFLRKLQGKDEEDSNVPLNRSAIIKSHLYSNSATTSTSEQQSNVDDTTKPKAQETDRKIVSEIPSPKKPFTIFQQSYHNSLLARGRGALARLAALATPLAADGDDAPKVNASSRGNFVFTAVTPHEIEPKVAKRKADTTPDTPRLLKKMKQQANSFSKSSLLDHL